MRMRSLDQFKIEGKIIVNNGIMGDTEDNDLSNKD